MKRVLTVFLTVIFMISSLSVPAFADDLTIDEIPDSVEVSDEIQTEADEAKQETENDVEIEEIPDDVPEDSAKEDTDNSDDEISEPSESDVELYGEGWDFGDDVINLLDLGSEYYDSESFEASPKVFEQDFEGDFDATSLGNDIDVSGQIDYRNDISVIKGSDAKFGDEDGEIGIEDKTTGTQEGSFLMWANRQTDAGNVLKFFDVFNRDGLTHADKNDKYALRFKLFIPRVDGLTRDRVQITLGTYSPMLHSGNGAYTSATPTKYTTAPKHSKTFVVPTGVWFDVFWDNDGAGVVPGELIVNQLGISSRMAFTTMYIDDVAVVRKEKVSSYTVDASDMQPFESSNYTKTDVETVVDSELGQVLKIAPNGSLKYSVNNFADRFIADKGGIYRVDIKLKNAEKIGIEGISSYIDRSKLDGEDYKTVNNRDFGNAFNIHNTQDYTGFSFVYTEHGIKDAVSFGGKNADIFRALNFVNLSTDKEMYVYDITVSKVNKYSPLPPFNAEFDNWGWRYAMQNSPAFVFDGEKLNINAVLDGSQSIESFVSLIKGAEYQVNFKAMSTDGETFKIKIVDKATGTVLKEISKTLSGTETEYCDTFELEGDFSENELQSVLVKIEATDKAVTVSDLKFSLINSVIDLDTSSENSIVVSGNLKDYTVNNLKAYLLLDSFDYNDSTSKKAEVDIDLNIDRTYEFIFDNIGETFSTQYYNNINVVIVGIDGIPYVAKSIRYESAKIKADLIRSIANAANADDIATTIRGVSGADTINNDIILGLSDKDFYLSSTTIIDDIADVLYGYKANVLNPDNNSDVELLLNEYLFAVTLAGANTKALTDIQLVDYTDRIKSRIGVGSEKVYNELYLSSEDDKKNAMKVLKQYASDNNCYNEASFKKTFLGSIFKNKLNECAFYSEVMEYLFDAEYRAFLGIDDTEWKPFSDLATTNYYTEAQVLIAAFAKSVYDINTIDDNISQLVATAIQNVNSLNNNGPAGGSGGGGGGGGSSSGGGGGFVIAPTVNSQINVSTNKYDPKPSTQFSDLSEFDWAKDYIDTLVSTGAVAGYEDGTFRPANNITRTEFAKILSVALDVYDEKAVCDYTDISSDNWGNAYVGSLAKLEVIKGKPDGSFGANDHITRQDVAVLVYRLVDKLGIKLPVVNRPVAFADDAEISDYAKEAVTALYQAGVISGVGDYRFDPNGYANRAQAAKIIAFFVK